MYAQKASSRYAGGQAFSTLDIAKPHARPYRSPHATASTNHNHTSTGTTGKNSGLPTINSVTDWAHLLHASTDSEFPRIVTTLVAAPGPPCLDNSSVALITPDMVQHFTYGSYQGTMEVQDYLSGIFNLLQIDPSISLL